MDLTIIKKIRKEKGLSQQDLGNMLGVSGAYIQQIENNKKNPSVKTLNKIASALNTPIETILSSVEIIDKSEFNSFIENNPDFKIDDLENLADDNYSKLAPLLYSSDEFLSDKFDNITPFEIENIYKLELSSLKKLLDVYEDFKVACEATLESKEKLIQTQEDLLDTYELLLKQNKIKVNLQEKIESNKLGE